MIARHQRQVQVTTGHARDERRRLFAGQLDINPAMTRSEALEDWCEVRGGVVFGHPEPNSASQRFAPERGLGFRVQREQTPGIPEQHLAIIRQLKMP
ncbi:hypothetical protein KF707C_22070 [Metapseudomonas furukawaii]|uniref:Uncharacterized protein n=1 Tax=Metapseudomonas furukawaii TaxID=1149133 RepID=A0AAD1BZ81_METFU|nr:hypothetical protein KF707C_22070 [Pseudomonas furukawaii]